MARMFYTMSITTKWTMGSGVIKLIRVLTLNGINVTLRVSHMGVI